MCGGLTFPLRSFICFCKRKVETYLMFLSTYIEPINGIQDDVVDDDNGHFDDGGGDYDSDGLDGDYSNMIMMMVI